MRDPGGEQPRAGARRPAHDQARPRPDPHDMLDQRAEIGGKGDLAGHPGLRAIRRQQGDALGPDRQLHRPAFSCGVVVPQGDGSGGLGEQAIAMQKAGNEVALADEAGDERVGRALVKIGLAADLLHPAVTHDHQPVGHRHGLVLIMGHHDRGDAAGTLQNPDLAGDLETQGGIEIGQRFVEQQQPRPHRQRPRQGDTLLLAAGQFARQAGGEIFELHQGEHLRHPLGDSVPLPAAHLQPEGDVAEDIEMGEQGVALEHDAHLAAMRRQSEDAGAIHPDVTAARRHEAGDHAQGRGLAAAGGAEQHDHLAGRHLEGDIGDRQMLGKAFRKMIEDEGARPGMGGHRTTSAMRTKRSSTSSTTPIATICTTATAATSGSM